MLIGILKTLLEGLLFNYVKPLEWKKTKILLSYWKVCHFMNDITYILLVIIGELTDGDKRNREESAVCIII